MLPLTGGGSLDNPEVSSLDHLRIQVPMSEPRIRGLDFHLEKPVLISLS